MTCLDYILMQNTYENFVDSMLEFKEAFNWTCDDAVEEQKEWHKINLKSDEYLNAKFKKNYKTNVMTLAITSK